MILTAIEEYFSSSLHKPFFAVASDEEYKELKIKLEEHGADFIRLSDCCRDMDKKPDLDLLRDKLRTADVDCKSNRVVVLGLAEYMLLTGDEYAFFTFDELKDFNLGSAWAVILLRGDAHIVKKNATGDPRFDNRRYFISRDAMPLDFDLLFSPSNVSMFENDGLKSLLIKMEDGESGEIGYNSDLEFPEATCRIRAIKDSYSAICKKNPGFGIPKEFGNDERWDYLLEQVTKHGTLESVFDVNDFKEDLETKFHERISGIANTCWLYFIYLYADRIKTKNSYLKYVLDNCKGFEDFKKKVVNAIIEISHNDPQFKTYYSERKRLLRGYPEAEMARFVNDNRVDPSESIYKLTDISLNERKEIIAQISQNGFPENLEELYPDLNTYMIKYHFQGDALSKELTDYFDAYKKEKMRNIVSSDFLEKVEKYAVSRDYNRLRTRDELIANINRDGTYLCWIDALGVEYLSFIVEGAKARGLMVAVNIGRANLPTITSVNNKFYYDWPEEHREKIEELDEIKHKDKGGYKYGPNNKYPIHLAEELAVLSDALDRAAVELALRKYDRFIIASDHGASRLAVISNIEEKYETDTRGEHSGRCCKKFDNYDLKFSTEENGFIVLANYGRFRGSRAANVEVHGGASLEEVVVPVIELTLADSSMQVALSDKNIVSDYKDGASILLYVNKPIKQVISLVVEGERYFGEKVDENHYRINVANMKRAKTYSADVYVGESLITRIDITTKGKSASVNSDFDDLF